MISRKQINNMSPEEQRTLLEKILKQKALQPRIRPLSFTQERLWFLHQVEPNNAFYNVAEAFRLQGVLDNAALEQSLNELVARHEILRTTFVEVAEEPKQIIAPHATVTIAIENLDYLSPEDRLAEARRITEAESLRPFDLAHGPLFKVWLLKLANDDQILLFIIHHIVADGWSFAILHQELETLYTNFHQGEPVSLPPLPIQYSNYAGWQRKHLQSRALEGAINYWHQHLMGAPQVLDLPHDYPRSATPSYRGASYPFTISAETVGHLYALGRQEGVTLFMLLITTFAVLLARYSGQEDIVIGVPIANRTRREIEGLIGFFANTLAMRIDLRGNPSFREAIQRARETCLGGYAHQDAPFEKLVETLRPERHLTHTPLFQVSMSLRNTPSTLFELPDLQVSSFEFENPTAKFDLSLDIKEMPNGDLEGVFEYAVDLFAPETIERMWGYFHKLIKAAIAQPNEHIWQLPLLNQQEQQEMVFTSAPRAYSDTFSSLHSLIEAPTTHAPDSIAVIGEDRLLSYRTLDEEANQLSHYLQTLGVKPETCVGILLVSSPDVIVAMLAILKAGGAFLPIPPSASAEQIAFILADSQMPVLISHSSFYDRLPLAPSRQDVFLDQRREYLQHFPIYSPDTMVSPANLAYISYTLGGADELNGVMITYDNLFHTICAHFPHYDTPPIFLLLSSYSFNSSIIGILSTLSKGGTLFLLSPPEEPDDVFAFIDRHNISHLLCLSGLYKTFLGANERKTYTLSTLQAVIVHGEVYPSELFVLHHQMLPHTQLFHVYGAAECTGWNAVRPFSAKVLPGAKTLIGQSMANTQTYILDHYFQIEPVGVPGRLYIGGSSVTRGYLNCPRLTAERFLPDPFSQIPGARLYCTDDITRYLADMSIEFLSHPDYKVEMRGLPINLWEIETFLRQLPNIGETAVLVQEHNREDKRLVAYITPCYENNHLEQQFLPTTLQQRLPGYMIPVAFIKLTSLPRTPSGRLDRKALSANNREHPENTEEIEEESNNDSVTQALIEIWKNVLHVEDINSTSNFFDLGGHSLLAIRMLYRIREVFHIDLPVHKFFEAPTVVQTASSIEELVIEQLEALPENE